MSKIYDEEMSIYDDNVNRECTRVKDNDKMAQKASEITADVAIKFAEFYFREQFNCNINSCESTEKLFEEFINNHYEK